MSSPACAAWPVARRHGNIGPMRALVLAMSWVFAAGAACSSAQPPAPVAPKGPSTCARVADHLVSLLSDTAKQAPVEELDRVRAGFTHHCEQDGWSDKAQQCFLTLGSKDEVDRCATELTPEQRAALEQPASSHGAEH